MFEKVKILYNVIYTHELVDMDRPFPRLTGILPKILS